MSLRLHDYQTEAVEAVRSDWASGHAATLGVAATGAGKTVIFLETLSQELAEHPDRRALIVAHRKELIEQPIERLAAFWPQLHERSGIVMAEQDAVGAQVIAATVQSLISGDRLERIAQHGPIDYVIMDEAHHATSASYKAALSQLAQANPALRHHGCTATPIRADGDGLIELYSKTSYSYDIRYLVQRGFLAPPRWLAIQTGISLAGVQSRQLADGSRDYNGKQLADVFEVDNCFDLVVESHAKYAQGRRALAFTQSVEGAYRLADRFVSAGIRASAADGTTAKGERADILARFRAGDLDVLVNVGLYTEGLDVPEVSCIHQVRPTQSDGLYIQMIGRGLRKADWAQKTDCLILDYAPKEFRQIVMLGDVLGVAARKDAYLQDQPVEGVLGGFTYDGKVRWLLGDAQELISRQLNYLDASPFSWHRAADGWMSLSLGPGTDGHQRMLLLSPPDKEAEVTLYKVYKSAGTRFWQASIGRQGSFDVIQDVAEVLINRYANAALAVKAKRWRARQPTPEQLAFAQRLGVEVKPRVSQGAVSDMISHALAMQAARQAQLV